MSHDRMKERQSLLLLERATKCLEIATGTPLSACCDYFECGAPVIESL